MSEATAKETTGKFVWYEWMGDDLDAAAAFYAGVLGWNVKDAGMTDFRYQIGAVGDNGVAGLMKIPAEAKAMGAPACWSGYIWVPDVDAAAGRLTAAGGKVMRPPGDIPGVGRFAVVVDPLWRGVHALPRRRRQSAAPARAGNARPGRLA